MASRPTIHRQMTPLEWALLGTLSVMWGSSFFFNQVAVGELPTLTVVVARVLLAALVLWIVILSTGRPVPRRRAVWLAFLGMGLLNNAIPFCLLVWGQAQIGSGVAAIINATTPLFSVLFAHVLTADEKMTANRVVGVLVGIAGVTVMVGAGVIDHTGGPLLAYAACVAAACSYGFAGIFGRRFATLGVTPMMTAAGQVTASSLILTPFMLVIDQPWTLPMPSMPVLLALVAVATISTAIGYILFFRVLATAGATNLMLVTLLVPVTALVLGILILDETLRPRHLLGMAMIGLGLLAIDGRPMVWLLRVTGVRGRAARS